MVRMENTWCINYIFYLRYLLPLGIYYDIFMGSKAYCHQWSPTNIWWYCNTIVWQLD